MANITGTDGADWINQHQLHFTPPRPYFESTQGADTIDGGGGDDDIDSGWGNDVVHGGDDKDTIWGHDSNAWDSLDPFAPEFGYVDNDIVFGDGGDDRLVDRYGNDTLDGGEGNDLVVVEQSSNPFGAGYYGADTDTLSGGAGNDTLQAFFGTDTLNGGADNDLILHGVGFNYTSGEYFVAGEAYGVASGDDGDDILRGGVVGSAFFGGGGNDTIAAHAGDDFIDGGEDHDLIVGGTGADEIYGGSGNDTIYTYGTFHIDPHLPNSSFSYEAWEYDGIAPDRDTSIDTADGGAGGDTINAGVGDIINGGADDDLLVLTAFLDENTVATTFDGGAGDDGAWFAVGTLEQHEGADGVDFITPITFVLDDDVTLLGLTLLDIEAIRFTSGKGDDEITGGRLDDHIEGNNGSDELHGRDGNDKLYGGSGNDTLDGGLGHDLLDGGDDIIDGTKYDSDTVDYSLAPISLPVDVSLVSGTATMLNGLAGDQVDIDTLVSIENIIGTPKDDFIEGNDENNRLEGRDGNDLLIGAGGDDTLRGGKGDDIVHGGEGFNDLEGGEGSDTLLYWDYTDDSRPLIVDLAIDTSNAEAINDFENIVGSALNDTFTGSDERNVIAGMGGNDILTAVNTHLPGGGLEEDWDLLDGGEGDDRIIGSLGTAVLAGGVGHDIIEGGAGDEKIFGALAPPDIDAFFSVDGEDDEPVDPVTDLILDFIAFLLGASNDPTYRGMWGQAFDAYKLTNTETIGDEVSGGLGDDDIIAAQGDDTINGDGGDDHILGFGGFDTLNGGSGDDRIGGGEDKDIIDGGTGIDFVHGGAGDDTLLVRTFHWDPNKPDHMEQFRGGAGIDTVDFSELGAPVRVEILNVTDPDLIEYLPDTTITATFGNEERRGEGSLFENIIGSTGDDEFIERNDGNPANRFEGRGGMDELDGGGGNDELSGGAQNDTLIGGIGDDTLDGGSGVDIAKFSGPRSAYTITHLSDGRKRVAGPDGTDTLTSVEKLVFDDVPSALTVSGSHNYSSDAPSNIDSIIFTGAAVATFASGQFTAGAISPGVIVAGSDGVNGLVIDASGPFSMAQWTFSDWSADDTITVNGSAGPDTITGASQADTMAAGDGADTLSGGAGADTLAGNRGGDRFVVDAAALADAQAIVPAVDRIADFNQGNTGTFSSDEGDQIDLSSILAATFDHGNGQPTGSLVRAIATAAGASLQIDIDGAANGASWITVAQLDGVHGGDILNVILDPTLPAGVSVSVAGAPDLAVLGTMTLTSQAVLAGTSTTVKYTLANSGAGPADASKVGFYRSSDSSFDASDTLLAEQSFGQISAQAQEQGSFALTLAALGTYFIIAVADHDDQIPGETSESNNPSNAVQVTVSDTETINNSDGTRTVHSVDALHQYSFTDYFINYDALGRATSQLTNNDDGSRIVFAFDAQSQSDWTDYHLTYDTQNRIVSQVTHNDDRSSIVFAWDVDNRDDWADYRVTYDSQDRPITQVTHNDDGSRIVFKWDRENQEEWSDYRVTYDSQDRPIAQVTNNDDGSRIVFKWDLDNQFNWSDYRVTDMQGRSLSQVTNNDDGTHLTYGWDADDQASWSDYVVTSDSQGRASEQTTNYDDGTHTVTTWDVQNLSDWREMTDYYNAQDNHVQQRIVYDDGTILIS